MDKISLDHPDSQSVDLVAQHIEQLGKIFPEVIKEGKVDFEALQDLLGNYTEKLFKFVETMLYIIKNQLVN